MRIRKPLPFALATAAAVLLLSAPAGAWDRYGRGDHRAQRGGHGHYGSERHHGGHDRHERHYAGHRHHGGCGHDGYAYAPRRVARSRGYPVYDHGGYYCGPCSHRFASYDALSHHVHHHHHVAAIQLPFVIFQASIGGGFGWVFDSY